MKNQSSLREFETWKFPIRPVVLTLCFFSLAAAGQVVTNGWKTLTGGAQSWGVAANWTNSVIPGGPSAFGYLNVNISAPLTVSLNSNTTVGVLQLGDTGGVPRTNTVIAAGTPGGALVFETTNNGAAILRSYCTNAQYQDKITANIILNAPLFIDGDATKDAALLTISGVISGTNSLAVTNVDALNWCAAVTLAGANTYSGGTMICEGGPWDTNGAGTIRIGVDTVGTVGNITSGALGTGTLTFRGGRLCSDGATARSIYNPVVILGGVNVVTAQRRDAYLGSNAVNKGTLTFLAPVTLQGGTRRLVVDSPVVFNAPIGEDGSARELDKYGASTMTLNAPNTWSGNLLINGGEVIVNSVGALNASGNNLVMFDNVTGNKYLTLNGYSLTIAGLTNSGGNNIGGALVRNNTSTDVTLTLNVPVDGAPSYGGALADGASGKISLVKIGLGTQVLTNGCTNGVTYTGTTDVREGKLVLGNNQTIVGSIMVSNGASLGTRYGSNQTSLTLQGNLNLGYGGGNAALEFQLGSLGGNPGTVLMDATGGFNYTGPVTVNVSGGSKLTTGVVPLLHHPGASFNLSDFTLGLMPVGVEGTLQDNPDTETLELNITLVANVLQWGGQNGSAWDLASTVNWTNMADGSAVVFNERDLVVFDDFGVTKQVNLQQTLSPSRITLSNHASAYTLSGAGSIAGNGSVLLRGSNAVSLLTANSYTAGTTNYRSALFLGSDQALGTGPVNLNFSNIVLASSGSSPRNLANPFTLASGTGGWTIWGTPSNTGSLTLSSPINFNGSYRHVSNLCDVVWNGGSTNGGLGNKSGLGTLTIRGSNDWTKGNAVNVRGGTLIIDGGVVTNTDAIRMECVEPYGTARFVVRNGAVVAITNLSASLRPGYNNSQVTATNIVDIAGEIHLSTSGTGGGQLQPGLSCAKAIANFLPGGLLEARQVTSVGSGVTEVNFDGGTLKVLTNSSAATFFQGITNTYILDGGATIDTAGFDVTINQALEAKGSGGVTKTGNGILTLGGANSYTGPTLVAKGKVAMTTTNNTGNGSLVVSNGGGLVLAIALPGSVLNAPDLTVESPNSGTNSLTFNLGVFGNPVVAPLKVNNLVVNGPARVNLAGLNLSPGVIPLMEFTGSSGNLNELTIGTVPAGVLGTLQIEGNVLEYVIAEIKPVIWSGAYSGIWDLGATANWLVNGGESVYTDGDLVLFPEVAANYAIDIPAQVAAGGVTISNASQAYSFSGAPINGVAPVVKQGPGKVTFNSQNTYGGGTFIQGGTVALGTNNALPVGGAVTLGNAADALLDLGGQSQWLGSLSGGGALGGNVALGGGMLTVSNSADASFAGMISGTGALTKANAGALSLSGVNTYTGGTTNLAGALRLGSDQALGTGPLTMVGGSLTAATPDTRTVSNYVGVAAGVILGAAPPANGTLVFQNTVDLNGAARTLTLNGDVRMSGPVTNGSITKAGGGSLTLTSNGIFNAAFVVQVGTLIVDGARLTNNNGFRPDAAAAAAGRSVALNLTNNGVMVITNPTSNFRVGNSGVNTATNIFNIGGYAYCPYGGTTNGQLQMGGAGALNIANLLPGGLLEVGAVAQDGNIPTEFNFAGGVLKAVIANGAFFQGISNVYVRDAGAIIDTTNVGITIAQNLQAGGTGGLTKLGASILTISGTNTYLGDTLINQGRITYMTTAETPYSRLVVASNASLGIRIMSPGDAIGMTNVALQDGGAVLFNLNGVGMPSVAPLYATNLQVDGLVSVLFSSGPVTNGTYPLIQFDAIGGAGALVPVPPRGMAFALSTNGTTIYVTATTADPVLWTGGTNGLWDLSSSPNWQTNGVATTYVDGDFVMFNDTAARFVVSLSNVVSPGSVVISNAATNYLFNGKAIAGPGGVFKWGAGSVTFSNGNTYAGLTDIKEGTLVCGSDTALGTTNGPTHVRNGATLDVNGSGLTNEMVYVEGAGVNGLGALMNSGAANQNAFTMVELTGNTTVNASNRFDVRGSPTNAFFSTGGRSVDLTKIGPDQFSLVACRVDPMLGNIDVKEGTFAILTDCTGYGDPSKAITIWTNAAFTINANTQALNKPLILNGWTGKNTMNIGGGFYAGGTNRITVPVTVHGPVTISAGVTNRGAAFMGGITGDGSVQYKGPGTLYLGGVNDYAGATLITAVSNSTFLILGTNATLPNSVMVQVTSNNVFDTTLAGGYTVGAGKTLIGSGAVAGHVSTQPGATLVPGDYFTAGTLTFSNDLTLGGGDKLLFNLAATPDVGNNVNDCILVDGNLTLNESVPTVVEVGFLTGAADTGGSYVLCKYKGTLSGDPTLALVATNNIYNCAIVNDPDNQQILLQVSGAGGALTWRGDGVNNLWNIRADANWVLNAAPALFWQLDPVLFDDTGSANPVANLVSNLTPAKVDVNSSFNYTLAGAGSLSGAVPINKSGSGTLIIANSNNLTSTVTISAGGVQVGDGFTNGTLGSGVTVVNNAKLILNRADAMTLGGTLSGGGTLYSEGSGVATLGYNGSNFTGNIVISNGTAVLGTLSAVGDNIGVTRVANGATLDINKLTPTNETIHIVGAGVGGNGALVNNGGAGQNNALRFVTLDGNATVGGSNRFDIRSLAATTGTDAVLGTGGNAYDLTKVGTNQFSLVSVSVDPSLGNIFVQQGTFDVERFTSPNLGDTSKKIYVASGAAMEFWQLSNVFNKPIELADGGAMLNVSGVNTNGAPMTLAGGMARFDVSANSLYLAGAVSGPGGLLKAGNSDLYLLTANSYAGLTVITQAGYLRVMVDGALPGDVEINSPSGAGLNFSPDTNVYINYNGGISGTGLVTQAAAGVGTTRLGGVNTYSGGTIINAGTIQLGIDNALGTGLVNLSGGGLSSDGLQPRTLANRITNSSGVTLGDAVNSGLLTLSGSIDLAGVSRTYTLNSDVVLSGLVTNGWIHKLGPATLYLRGPVFFGGIENVSSGTMVIDGCVVTNTAGTRPNCNATNGFARLVITNGGSLIMGGGGSNVRVGVDQTNTVSTNILDVAGIVRTPAANANNGLAIIGSGCAYGVLNLWPGGELEVAGVTSGDSTTNGVSEFNFHGGILRATASSATFMLGLTNAFVGNGGAMIDSAGFNLTIGQNLLSNGTGGLTKVGNGTLILSNANSYAGDTVVAGGTLTLTNAGTLGTGTNITLLSNAVFDVSGIPQGLAVAAYQVLGGNGTVNGDVVAQGTLSPGTSIGALMVMSNLTLAGTTVIEINKDAATNDVVKVAGTLTYGGVLEVRSLSAITAVALGDVFPVFAAGAYQGSFASIQPAPGPGLSWQLQSDGSLLAVSAGTAPAISVQPQDVMAYMGMMANFSVTATGTEPMSYQWFQVPDVQLGQATNAALSLTNVQLADSGRAFQVVVANGQGSVTSRVATLSVSRLFMSSPQVNLADGHFGVSVDALPGYAYWLDARTNLMQTNWSFVIGITNQSGAQTLSDPNPTTVDKYYRLGAQPAAR